MGSPAPGRFHHELALCHSERPRKQAIGCCRYLPGLLKHFPQELLRPFADAGRLRLPRAGDVDNAPAGLGEPLERVAATLDRSRLRHHRYIVIDTVGPVRLSDPQRQRRSADQFGFTRQQDERQAGIPDVRPRPIRVVRGRVFLQPEVRQPRRRPVLRLPALGCPPAGRDATRLGARSAAWSTPARSPEATSSAVAPSAVRRGRIACVNARPPVCSHVAAPAERVPPPVKPAHTR